MGGNGSSGPGAAFVDYAAADGVLLSGLDVSNGKQQIDAAFSEWRSGLVLEWGPDRPFGVAEGRLAFTVGNSATRNRDRGENTTIRRGHFMTIWRLETNGRWAYIFDLGSPRPPLPDERQPGLRESNRLALP